MPAAEGIKGLGGCGGSGTAQGAGPHLSCLCMRPTMTGWALTSSEQIVRAHSPCVDAAGVVEGPPRAGRLGRVAADDALRCHALGKRVDARGSGGQRGVAAQGRQGVDQVAGGPVDCRAQPTISSAA